MMLGCCAAECTPSSHGQHLVQMRHVAVSLMPPTATLTATQVETVEDYDLYCHYVAGLVGIGLSQLFSASGRESPELATNTELANHMGLFLQKTNIIRDYLVCAHHACCCCCCCVVVCCVCASIIPC